MKTISIVEKILNFVNIGDKVAVGVSGGMDSMVLLHAVKRAAEHCRFSFFVVNIEHGIRGENSVKDSKFVKDYCDDNQIEFKGFSVNAPAHSKKTGMTLENAARDLRYSVFKKLIDDSVCNKIFLAHHMSDQAETVLMRIIRGTGIAGLCGMSTVNGVYFRPLLETEKKEIIEYQQNNCVPFVTDETNFDNDFTRNLLRNEIIPSMKKISPDVEGSLVRLSRLAKENENFLSNKDNPICLLDDMVKLEIMDGEEKLLFKRRVKKCFQALGVFADIEERHYEILFNALNLPNGTKLDMPYGVIVSKEYGSLVFTKTKNCLCLHSVSFKIGQSLINGQAISIIPFIGEKIDSGELMFDITKIPSDAVLRRRENGDAFTKFGGGTKSLGDYLTDKKIPLRLRNDLIVCASGNDILFIAGLEISDKIKTDESTDKKDIFKITLEDKNVRQGNRENFNN